MAPGMQPDGKLTQPWNQEAEESVVGGILLYPKAFLLVADVVAAEDFYHPALKAIFGAMVELDAASKPIDSITVAMQMRASDTFGRLRAFNGESYFAELMSKVVTVENIGYHAKIVRNKATVRRLIEAAQEVAARGYGEYGDVDEFIQDAERSVFELAQRLQRASYEPVKRILGATINDIEKRYDRKQAVTGVPSGYTKLDAMTAGFQPGDLVIIAARPSMGKTSLVMNAVQNAAIEHGLPALVFSLEMSKKSLLERMLCCEARIDSQRLRSGMLETRDWLNLTKAASRVSEAPIFIDDVGAPTLLDVRAKARRWRNDPEVFDRPDQMGVVVIDYIQLMQGKAGGKGEANRQQEISDISRGLKALAKELRVPVIALSQLNRGVESRSDKRPQLSDLRECVTGDTVVMLADGRRVPIASLVGTTPEVLAMTAGGQIVAAQSECVWLVGRRSVTKITLAGGKTLRATGQHRVYTSEGWKCAEELQVGDRVALALAVNDNVSWDRVVTLAQDGEENVFDLTVPGPASWLADGIVSHNSGALEQDADLIAFIYRDEVYNGPKDGRDSPEGRAYEHWGIAEVIIGKQRNGPIGTVKLAFLNQYTRFESLSDRDA